MPSPLIEFRDWSIRLPGGDRPALNGVSLSIAAGERVLVTGPSGGGKSSLIRAIANLHDLDSTVATGELVSRIRTVGFVGQEPDEQILFPTVGEEIAFVAETTVSSADKVERRIRESLRATGITTPLSHRTSNLSGGEKQRLAIASALAGKPDILVMDEPTASLDEASIQLVVQSVERVLSKPRSTMVIVEHHIEVWRHLVDRIIVIAGGEVVADGPIDDVLTKRRSMLIALGVWLPNHTAAPKPTRPRKKATTVMSVRGLVARRSPTADLVSIPDFDLAEGEVVALVGPNGSGKSTALRALGGLLEPLDGSVRYSGDSRPPHTLRATELIHHVGSVLQNPAYGFGVGRVNDEAPAHERAAVGLKGLDNRHPQSLSGGERRRLGLASALSRRPRILFLDEPSFGQDANSWLDLIDRLRDFLEGRGAIVVASHDHRLVASLAHRVIEIGGDGE